LLQSGAAKWDNERNDLSYAIETARAEFQNERNERLQGMQDQVGALVDMYAQSLQVISTAVSSGQELVKKLGIRDANGEYVKFSRDADPALAAWRQQTWSTYKAQVSGEIAQFTSWKTGYQKAIDADPLFSLFQQRPELVSSYEVFLSDLIRQFKSYLSGIRTCDAKI